MQKISLEVKSQEIRQLHILYITNTISLLLDFIYAGLDTNFFSILVQRASIPKNLTSPSKILVVLVMRAV